MIKVSEIKIKSKVDWNSLNWRKIQLRVWRIQKKIYDCSRRSEKFKVIKLQKILINLPEAKLLAVRKIVQDNRGKKTAGVDGVRLLAPTKRFQLAYSLKIDGRRGRALGNRAFSKSILRILRNQDNKCNVCNLKFLPGDVIEIDHIVPKASGGADHYGNLQALHGHCHDQKS